MKFDIPQPIRRQARAPHELAMINLLLFNLLMLIALLAGSFLSSTSALAEYKLLGVLAPGLVSLGIIAYSFWRAAQARTNGPWFVAAHWRLATGRYRILLIAYLAGAALIGLGWLLSQLQADPRMASLMFVALQRVAVAPMLITLMVLIMLESGAIYVAEQGQVPDALARRLPPPAELQPLEAGDNAAGNAE
jgi:hypothetical protein